MPSHNYASIIGHLTRDPEQRMLPTGTPCCEFSVAVNEHAKEKEYVSYLDCVAFGRLAEVVAQHCRKGMAVFVAGRVRQERWRAADGSGRSRVRIVASTVQFLGGGKKEANVSPQEDEDIPF